MFDALHNGRLGLWAAREKATWRGGGPGQPVLLGGSLAIAGRPLPQPSTSDIFVLGTQAARTEVVRSNEQQSQFRPFISGLSADQLDISPDGQWLAYVTYPEETLWKCRRDGTGSSQLAPTSFAASAPRWSPDGTQIVFMGKDASMGAWRLYLIPEAGGVPQPLVETGAEQGVATWFPDSRALVFGNLIVSAPSRSSRSKIHQFDLVNRKLMTIPGSEGLWTARLSPDGRFIAALTSDNQTVMLYEVAKGTWSPLAHTQPISDIAWTRHSGAIFFDDLRHRDGIFRLTLNTHQIAKVASLAGIQAYSSWWLGLSADDSPMLVHDVGSEEIYALHCNFP